MKNYTIKSIGKLKINSVSKKPNFGLIKINSNNSSEFRKKVISSIFLDLKIWNNNTNKYIRYQKVFNSKNLLKDNNIVIKNLFSFLIQIKNERDPLYIYIIDMERTNFSIFRKYILNNYKNYKEITNKELKLLSIIILKNLHFKNLDLIYKYEIKEFKDNVHLNTKYLYDLFNKFENYINYIIDNYKIDFFKQYSLSHISFSIFRTNYLSKDIPLLPFLLLKDITKSYFGGLTFIFKNKAKNINHYDINSMYPYSMLKPLPGKFLETKKNLSIEELINKNYMGFSIVKIDNTNSKKGIIPIRKDDKLIFPISKEIETVIFNYELIEYYKIGYKIKISKTYIFESIKDTFKDFIKHFYFLKSQNNEYRFLYKFILNSLYGYLGKTPNYMESNILKKKNFIDFINNKDISVYNYDLINKNKFYVKYIDKERSLKNHSIYNNIAISSAITSYARIKMIPYLLDKDTIYSDTDSIYTYKKYKTGNEIGELKLETKISEIIIKKPKFYYIKTTDNKEIIKSAGLNSKLLNKKDFLT